MKIALIDVYHQFHFELVKSMRSFTSVSYAITGTRENWHGSPEVIESLHQELFQQVTTNDVTQFLFPDKILQLLDHPWVLSQQILEKYAPLESYFLRMTDRNAVQPISVHQRRKYYHIILNYFLNLLNTHPVDFAIAFDTPHSSHSFLFYKLLEDRGIPVIRLEYHFLADHSLMLFGERLPEIPGDFTADATYDELWQSLPSSVKKSLSTRNTFTEAYIAKEQKKVIRKGPFFHLQLALKVGKKFAANLIMGLFPFFFKKEILHFTSLNNISSPWVYRRTINKRLKEFITLQKKYGALATFPDKSKPFIFLGLHMQPEKTSLPMGKEYDHQLNAALTLAEALPKGWTLFVKEHPNQFNVRKIANLNFRDSFFYKALNSHPNIQLIPLEVDAKELIHHARLVATLTGTLGWEALEAGKPVIVFGDAYYQACKAVALAQSVADCQQAIADLQGLTAEKVKWELLRYLRYYSEKGYIINASNWEEKIESGQISREIHIQRISKSIQAFCKSHFDMH